MKIAHVLALAALAVGCSAKVMADERVAQAPVNVAMCKGCHGSAGYRTAFPEVYSVPKLGGQQSAYLVKALQDYRSGARKHATMRSIAAPLSDQEIAALAAYYAGTGK
jgi:cytochrome c553